MRRCYACFLLINIVLVFNTLLIKAQSYLPIAHDNYAGVTSIYLQPASIADSRYRFDVILAGVSFSANNNFFFITKNNLQIQKLLKPRQILQLNNDKRDKYLYQNSQIQMLGFMLSINPKISFGITSRIREFSSADNISNEIARFLYYNFDVSALFGMEPDQQPKMNFCKWREYDATIAGVVWNNDRHFIKAGATLKLLQGMSAAYLKADIHQVLVKGTDSIGTNGDKIKFNYGVSGDFFNEIPVKKTNRGLNVGFDIGVVYEWRPNINKYCYEMDGRTDLKREDKNKYLLKVGVSLLDMGKIKYKKDFDSQDFSIQTEIMQYFNIGVFENVDNIKDFTQVIDSLTSLSPNDINYGIFKKLGDDDHYKMILPSALSIQIDYNISKNFYINFSPYMAFYQKNSEISHLRVLPTMDLTLRYETPHLGVSLPFQYNKISRLTVGLGLHLGPVWLCSNNLLEILFSKEIYNANVNVGIKLPIRYKLPKDFDGDRVSDKKDRCKEEFGFWENQGCPKKDSDGDLIFDEEDECPNMFGLKEFNGCPDSDNDGLPDHKDDCPEVFGFPELNGCPDVDGDGISDNLDDCPEVFGLPEFNGCPDIND